MKPGVFLLFHHDCAYTLNRPKKFGGAKRDRTADLYNAIVALSQLSYSPQSRNQAPLRGAGATVYPSIRATGKQKIACPVPVAGTLPIRLRWGCREGFPHPRRDHR